MPPRRLYLIPSTPAQGPSNFNAVRLPACLLPAILPRLFSGWGLSEFSPFIALADAFTQLSRREAAVICRSGNAVRPIGNCDDRRDVPPPHPALTASRPLASPTWLGGGSLRANNAMPSLVLTENVEPSPRSRVASRLFLGGTLSRHDRADTQTRSRNRVRQLLLRVIAPSCIGS